MKRFISLALIVILCMSLFAVPAFAASASASLTGPGTVRAGDTLTLTFSLNGTGIFGASGVLAYDPSQLTLTGTNQKIGNGWAVEFSGNNFVAYDNNLAKPINGSTAVFSVSFKVNSNLATDTAIHVSYTDVTTSDGSTDTNIGTVTYSVAVAAPLSSDNTLKSLTVSNADISPAFSADTTSYTVEVPFEVSKLDVKAEANDGRAKVSVSSPELTPDGTTNVTVTVTAENGSKKTYTIAVKRAQDPNYVPSGNNDLSGISVEGFLLSPVFSPENTQYVIWLPYETDKVTVSGTAADGKASVTVEGGSGLTAGADNEIKVICTAEDGTQKVYTIIAKRASVHGSTDATEPGTEPATEPETQPSVPAEPQAPAGTCNCGSLWWMLLIVGILCLAVGAAAGIFVDRKYLNKK